MKHLLIAALFASTAVPAAAQTGAFQTEAFLIDKEEGKTTRVWITNATRNAIRYKVTAISSETTDARLEDFASVYLIEPAVFTQAMDLYQDRKYQEAIEKFVMVRNRFKPVEPLPGNHGTLAAFYEMECLRKLGDLEGLAKALAAFNKGGLTRPHHLRQLEINVIWDTVRTKNWERLEVLVKEQGKATLPDYQRAQLAYCQGLAHEAMKRPNEALKAYQTTLTADAGLSEEITRPAAIRIMRILKDDADVAHAAQVWGTPQERKGSAGYNRLLEAGAVARMFEEYISAGTPLPNEFKELKKFVADPAQG